MQILYITHLTQLPVHQYIIDHLRANGVVVDVEIIYPAPKDDPWGDVWVKFRSAEFEAEVKEKKYDFIISNTHSSYIRKFFKAVTPKFGIIDIEHDLLSLSPECVNKNSTVLTFHKKHHAFCLATGLKAIRCRWPLIDIDEFTTLDGVDKWNDAVLIGSYIFNKDIKEDNVFTEFSVFNTVWYKKYQSEDYIFSNTTELPDIFNGPKGTKFCMDLFNFVVVLQSSCFVEALLLNSLPILINTHVKNERKVDDILSVVDLCFGGTKIKNIHAVTLNNIEYKWNVLKSNEELYYKTIATMRANWVDDDYFDLPPVQEVLCDLVLKGEVL